MKIPKLDLTREYARYQGEIDAAMAAIIAGGHFIGSPEFESDFAQFHGSCHCVGLGNGTDALTLACRALGLGPGDEVIVPSLTFFASAEAISAVGARPIFAEVDTRTYCLDLNHAQSLLSQKTKAIVCVHLYGQAAALSAISNFAETHRIFLIEDCAQAVGAEHQGQKVGTWGDVGCFSFFPSKNLGAWGDAGAVLTQNGDLAQRIRMLANHGRSDKYRHEVVGVNSRLDALQGAILRVKLRHLREIIASRRRVAAAYRRHLAALAKADCLTLPYEDADGSHVYHQFVIQTEARDPLHRYLWDHGIESAIHYPQGCHAQPAYAEAHVSLPRTDALTQRILSLPLFPEMTADEIAYVAKVAQTYYRSHG